MMWDFGGGGQGSSPYYVQQHPAASSSAPSFPAAYGDYNAGPPPMPFMPIGAPASDHIFVDRYHGSTPGIVHRPWAVPGASPAPVARSPVAVHGHSHHRTHQSHSHSHSRSHSHSHNHGHGHASRPTVQQHSSTPVKLTRTRPQPDPIQPVHASAHASSSRPHFIYSKCTGRKKALCVGINYRGQPNRLHGCVNDARNVQGFLMSHGYSARDIEILTDDTSDPRRLPTRANILEAMRRLVKDAHPHDSLFFHYSGHGGQIKDKDGDEIDGYDEIIFPLDHKSAGYISDDLMHTMMVKPLPPGCRLTALFDSCHSGSVLDLPYLYHSDGRVKGSQVTKKWHDYKATLADVITWSGCKDSQTSADTWEQGVATGAMSHAFISSLAQNPKQSYQDLLRSVRVILKKKYSQKPQLSSSHHIDTNLRFIF